LGPDADEQIRRVHEYLADVLRRYEERRRRR